MSLRLVAHSRRSVVGWPLIVYGLASLSCATLPTGATAEDLSRANGQAGPGATVFANECAKCHGQRGEGLGAASPVLGPGALPEYPRAGGAGDPMLIDPQQIQIQAQTRPAGAAWRDPFRNAQDLYGFTVKHMPKNRADDIKDGDYWALVSFILAVQGATVPPGGINAGNAASIPIPKR